MGYEIKLIIGRASSSSCEEYIDDKTKPLKDGSGYEWKKDAKGNYITTGRRTFFFMVYATLDLCKIGYDDNAMNRLVEASHDTKNRENDVYYFYQGDKKTKEDCYGDRMYPVPVKDVIKAIKQAQSKGEPYRCYAWAIALLNAMSKDAEKLQVLFYGY